MMLMMTMMMMIMMAVAMAIGNGEMMVMKDLNMMEMLTMMIK